MGVVLQETKSLPVLPLWKISAIRPDADEEYSVRLANCRRFYRKIDIIHLHEGGVTVTGQKQLLIARAV